MIASAERKGRRLIVPLLAHQWATATNRGDRVNYESKIQRAGERIRVQQKSARHIYQSANILCAFKLMWTLLDAFSPVISGLSSTVVISLILMFPRRPQVDIHGWKKLQPGSMHWLGLGLFFLIAAFLTAMMWHEQGLPSLDDHASNEERSNIFWFYVVWCFGCCGVVLFAWTIRLIRTSEVRWRDGKIAFRQGDRDLLIPMIEIADISRRWDGRVSIHFSDGTELKLDEYARGVGSLFDEIVAANEAQHSAS